MKHNISKPSVLYLTVYTWEKDSHGLYDYEATKHHKENYSIQGPCKLFRNWHTSQTLAISNQKIKRGQLPDENLSFHASITLKHNGNFEQFVLGIPQKPSQDIFRKENNSDQPGPLNTNSYVAVRYFKGDKKIQGHPINIGNIIKLGRVEFRAMEIGGTKTKGKKQESFLQQFEEIYVVSQQILGTCKFCLCDEITDDNFLISPCLCKGSCQVVHVQCLKMWINSKIKKQVFGVVSTYNFSKFKCQLCQQPFPRKVIKGQEEKIMIEIQKPTKPYLMLENVNERKQAKDERCLHLLCPEEGTPVKMGRGHQCQIRLQDISVSRMHSEIRFEDGNFYLTDQNSKFGTLVGIDRPIPLNKNIKIQAGRSLYQFSLE